MPRITLDITGEQAQKAFDAFTIDGKYTIQINKYDAQIGTPDPETGEVVLTANPETPAQHSKQQLISVIKQIVKEANIKEIERTKNQELVSAKSALASEIETNITIG